MGWGSRLAAGLQNGTKAKRWDAHEARLRHQDFGDEGGEEEREEEEEDEEEGRYELDRETLRPEDSISTIDVDLSREAELRDYYDGIGEGTLYPEMGMRAGRFGRGTGRTPLAYSGGLDNMYTSFRDPYATGGSRFPRSTEFDTLEDDYMMDRGTTGNYGLDGSYGLDDYDSFGVDSGIGGGFGASSRLGRRSMDPYPSNQFHPDPLLSDPYLSDPYTSSNLISEEELMGSRYSRGPLLPRDSAINQNSYLPQSTDRFTRRMFSNPSLGNPYLTEPNRARGRSVGALPGALIPLSKSPNLTGKKVVADLGRVIISSAQLGISGLESEPLLMQEMRKTAYQKGADGVVEIRLFGGRAGDLTMEGRLVQTASSVASSLSGSTSQFRSAQNQRFGRNDFGPTTRPPVVRSSSHESYGMRPGIRGESRRMGLDEDIGARMRDSVRPGVGGIGAGRSFGGRGGYY